MKREPISMHGCIIGQIHGICTYVCMYVLVEVIMVESQMCMYIVLTLSSYHAVSHYHQKWQPLVNVSMFAHGSG